MAFALSSKYYLRKFSDILHYNGQWNLWAYLVVILKNKSMKSLYYPIHEISPLKINP